MRQTSEHFIDGSKYTSTQYPATTGQKLLVKLGKLFGEPLAMLAEAAKKDDGLLDADMNLPELVKSVFAKLEPEQSVQVAEEILCCTRIHKGDSLVSIQYDLDFAGRYKHLFKLLAQVLKFQFSDFLGDLPVAEHLAAGMEKIQSKAA